jgi:DNA-binding IscR family transcriptional regulator
MKLSTRSQYGLLLMLELALSYKQNPVQLKAVADSEGLSLGRF